MPNCSARNSSTTNASIDFFHNSGSGLARLMRYESCEIGCVIPSSASDVLKLRRLVVGDRLGPPLVVVLGKQLHAIAARLAARLRRPCNSRRQSTCGHREWASPEDKGGRRRAEGGETVGRAVGAGNFWSRSRSDSLVRQNMRFFRKGTSFSQGAKLFEGSEVRGQRWGKVESISAAVAQSATRHPRAALSLVEAGIQNGSR